MSARFIYWRCPVCEFDLVSEPPTDERQAQACPMCFDDSARRVRMDGRPATAADKPEGPDARL